MLSGGIAAWEQRRIRQNITQHIVLSIFQYTLRRFTQWCNVLEKILNASNFRSTFAATLKVTKRFEAKKSPVIRWKWTYHQWYVNALKKIQIIEPLWPSCRHGENTILLYTNLLCWDCWSYLNTVLFWHYFFQDSLNLMRKIDHFHHFLA